MLRAAERGGGEVPRGRPGFSNFLFAFPLFQIDITLAGLATLHGTQKQYNRRNNDHNEA